MIDLIGSGGMGSVYRAYDPKLIRNVALKLIRVERRVSGEGEAPRLLREAQALARVVHPHVVSVFDVGEFGEQVFFAMELIEGNTLQDVLRGGERDPRRLLHLLDQAGRGLAAAHDAGLVHRDFKPGNVLIDREQRAKVGDFGLARAIDPPRAEVLVATSPPAPESLLDRNVTKTGAFLGTPAYMAPEQYLGLRPDARSDQFSFSIAAYEALFGRHPFFNESGALSVEALCAGRIDPPSRRVDPGYVRVLRRGLSRDPADRYPSIQHLLDDLVHVPRRRRRRGMAIATVACAVVGLVGIPAFQKYRVQRCDAATSQALADIWDPPRREKVENVLVGDGRAFGREVWKRVATTLDGYADQWKHASTELCRSKEWWRVEDTAIHTRASSCLDERRRELRAVTDVLATGDRDVRLSALDILIQLDALSTCTNPAALALTPLPTHDGNASSTAGHIRDLIAQSRALNDARKLPPSEEAARQALALAQKVPDRALAAEALYRLSIVQNNSGNDDQAEASLIQALADAESSGHERLVPLIWTQLIGVVGYGKAHPDEVERVIPFVESSVKRFDPQGPANVEFLVVRGLLETRRGRYDRAIEYLGSALEMAQRVFGENDRRRIEIYQHLASAEMLVNQLDKAIDHTRSALVEAEALFGNEHPQLVITLSLLARMLSSRGDGAGADVMAKHALHIIEQTPPAEIPDLGQSLFELSIAYLEDAQPAVALPLCRRSRASYDKNDPNATVALVGIARIEEALGHLETARTTFEEALGINRRTRGPGHPETIRTGFRLGRLLRKMHRERDALQLCTQILDEGERALGPHGVSIALALSCVGEGYEQLGQLPKARTALERAETILEEEAIPPRPEYRATIRFALARVLWQTGGDRERALRLAHTAEGSYQHASRAFAQDRVAIQTWLGSR